MCQISLVSSNAARVSPKFTLITDEFGFLSFLLLKIIYIITKKCITNVIERLMYAKGMCFSQLFKFGLPSSHFWALSHIKFHIGLGQTKRSGF